MFDTIKHGELLDFFRIVSMVFTNFLIAWGVWNLKKWAVPVGLLSQVAVLANFAGSFNVLALVSKPLPLVFVYILGVSAILFVLVPILITVSVLIWKRKEFIY